MFYFNRASSSAPSLLPAKHTLDDELFLQLGGEATFEIGAVTSPFIAYEPSLFLRRPLQSARLSEKIQMQPCRNQTYIYIYT